MEKISYKIDVFEGPMDLLLHLISKNKLNINDIAIFDLVEQYINYVRSMQDQNMEVASEFLEMAARLIYIKTVSLLPKHEEAEILKKELTGELIEYRDCQIMAGKLAGQTEGFNRFVRNPAEIETDKTYRRLHELVELVNSYAEAVGTGQKRLPPPAESFRAIVAREFVKVSLCVTSVMRKLWKGHKIRFYSLFETAQSRSELVATFLAVLELAKAKKISIEGSGEDLKVQIVKEADGI